MNEYHSNKVKVESQLMLMDGVALSRGSKFLVPTVSLSDFTSAAVWSTKKHDATQNVLMFDKYDVIISNELAL